MNKKRLRTRRRAAERTKVAPRNEVAPAERVKTGATRVYRNFLVAFLDSLAQSAPLLEFGTLQETDVEQLKTVLDPAVRQVLEVREAFERFFEKVDTPSKLLDSLPPHAKQRALATRRADGTYRMFSDSLLVSVPLSKAEEFRGSTVGVWRAMTAAASVTTLALAEGKPIRGGIEIAVGIEIAPGEVYGPALAQAYVLESTHAEYPRVLIGDAMWRYLEAIAGASELQTPEGKLARRFAELSMQLVTVDPDDGRRMLDIFGVAARDAAAIEADTVRKAYGFAVSQVKRFADAGDQKLYGRYRRLVEYLIRRLPLWGIAP
jgi:hypothetical protein